ncbi:unnamed protein product [Rotaria magnacalcarata]|uniref:Uncharacterized protein n=2 Tax=Rotaria magnacalcarata TaxID=392030 RepID=A0A8S2J6B9_9BILA|nr:unnamed protein product [Rotaria magnacalcarata]CAF3789301.1 unnamed protein product [Rotaria magnacalcarata]
MIYDDYCVGIIHLLVLFFKIEARINSYRFERQIGSTIVLPPCILTASSSVDDVATILFKSDSGELLTMNGMIISNNPRLIMKNAHSSELIIKLIESFDEGHYECRTDHLINYIVHLMVINSSTIYLNVLEGSNVTLQCKDKGMWIIEESHPGGSVCTQYTPELVLNNLQRNDNRFQKITCSMLDGHEKREYIIDIMYKPTVKLEMLARQRLMCIICAHPLPHRIYWWSQPVRSADDKIHQTNINQSCIAQQLIFELENDDIEPIIICEAENMHGIGRDSLQLRKVSIRSPGEVVNEVYSQNIQSIIHMCLDAGDDPGSIIDEVKYELQKMVTEMMAEDGALLERKRTELAPIRTRYESLYHELYPDKTCPQYGSTLPVLLALRTYVDEHKKLKEEYEKLLKREIDIRLEEKRLCNELNERSLQIDNQNFISKQLVTQMSLLSEHITELRDEKSKRLTHLSEILRTLHEFEEVYGWKRPTVETMIGRLLALGPLNIDQFTLTKEAVELVDKEFSQITEQVQKAEARFEQSHKQLASLMRKHQSLIPNNKVLSATKIKQCRLSKLPDLIAEVDRYTEHAMEKLTNDIFKARERIHGTLNKLSFQDVTNDSKYAILYTNDFTEDIYFMHEELLQELEAQYEVNKSMYEQIEIWNELFLEFQEFEKNASDPQRFHRRGYSALAEEKNRRRLEATLRDCELRLQHLASGFMEKNNGQPFIMSANGKKIPDYIQQRKDDYTKAKEREREAVKTPSSKKKARTDIIVRARPAPLQSVPGSDENNNNNEYNQCATTLCAAVHKTSTNASVGRTPLKAKQLSEKASSVVSKRSNPNLTARTPLKSVRRVAVIPHLPTGKTPLHNSTMKLRTQKFLQTTKRTNMDQTSSTIVTPVKQRCLNNQIFDATANISSNNLMTVNVSTGFKISTATTPGKCHIVKRAIPTPIHTHKNK